MSRDSSLCFPISHRVRIVLHVLWLDIRGTAGLYLGISFPLSGILIAISISVTK